MESQGNFNTFESVRSEQLKNQKRAFEAEKAKRDHMQEFVDKFRCNAKRASLVQSRIKALDKMEVCRKLLLMLLLLYILTDFVYERSLMHEVSLPLTHHSSAGD